MTTLDTYLEMLASPNADTRYDGCEGLRVANESSEQVILALENAINDHNADVAEAARKALRSVAHQEMLETLGRAMPRSEAERQQEEQAKAMAGIVTVTTPSIDGFRVAEYLGIVSAEVVISTGFLSEFGAGLTDLSSAKTDTFRETLRDARDSALRDLRLRAVELQANAALGVTLTYSALSPTLLMVAATGTAARIEPA